MDNSTPPEPNLLKPGLNFILSAANGSFFSFIVEICISSVCVPGCT